LSFFLCIHFSLFLHTIRQIRFLFLEVFIIWSLFTIIRFGIKNLFNLAQNTAEMIITWIKVLSIMWRTEDWSKWDLSVTVQTSAPSATFDPRLPQSSQKNYCYPWFKASVMIHFARRSGITYALNLFCWQVPRGAGHLFKLSHSNFTSPLRQT